MVLLKINSHTCTLPLPVALVCVIFPLLWLHNDFKECRVTEGIGQDRMTCFLSPVVNYPSLNWSLLLCAPSTLISFQTHLSFYNYLFPRDLKDELPCFFQPYFCCTVLPWCLAFIGYSVLVKSGESIVRVP
jgi:hypothetical protein